MSIKLGKLPVQQYVEGIGDGVISEPKLSSLNIKPTPTPQRFLAKDEDLDGYNIITVEGDSNFISSNIKKGVSIFGITGTLEQNAEPEAKYANVIPTTTKQTVKENNFQVDIAGSTNLVPQNIKEGITIFGVHGTVKEHTEPEPKSTIITPSTTSQTVRENNFTVQVKGDLNLSSPNIVKGKSIFGVNGSYVGLNELNNLMTATDVYDDLVNRYDNGYRGYYKYTFSGYIDSFPLRGAKDRFRLNTTNGVVELFAYTDFEIGDFLVLEGWVKYNGYDQWNPTDEVLGWIVDENGDGGHQEAGKYLQVIYRSSQEGALTNIQSIAGLFDRSITRMGYDLFKYVPDPPSGFYEYQFLNFIDLEEVYMPESISYVQQWCFAMPTAPAFQVGKVPFNAGHLHHLDLNQTAWVYEAAFYGSLCGKSGYSSSSYTGTIDLVLRQPLYYIGPYAFAFNYIDTLRIEKTSENILKLDIQTAAFANNTHLKSVEISTVMNSAGNRSVITLNTSIFEGCTALETFIMTPGVYLYGGFEGSGGIFRNCPKLTTITFLGTMAEWEAEDKGKYWNEGSSISYIQCTDGTLSI